jgi:hypothetical protein
MKISFSSLSDFVSIDLKSKNFFLNYNKIGKLFTALGLVGQKLFMIRGITENQDASLSSTDSFSPSASRIA